MTNSVCLLVFCYVLPYLSPVNQSQLKMRLFDNTIICYFERVNGVCIDVSSPRCQATFYQSSNYDFLKLFLKEIVNSL